MTDLTNLGNEELFQAIVTAAINSIPSKDLFKEYMLRLSCFDRPAQCHVLYFNEYKLIPWCVLHQQEAKNFNRCCDNE